MAQEIIGKIYKTKNKGETIMELLQSLQDLLAFGLCFGIIFVLCAAAALSVSVLMSVVGKLVKMLIIKSVKLWQRFFRRLVEANRVPGSCKLGEWEYRSRWTHPAL